MINVLPHRDSNGVIPVDKPTVPKADTVSNRYDRNSVLGASEIFPCKELSAKIKNRTSPMRLRQTRINEMERLAVSTGMLFLNRFNRFCLLILLTVNATIKANEVVFTPPPQEPGEAPKNINPVITIKVASVNVDISTVLKPAVRHVTD